MPLFVPLLLLCRSKCGTVTTVPCMPFLNRAATLGVSPLSSSFFCVCDFVFGPRPDDHSAIAVTGFFYPIFNLFGMQWSGRKKRASDSLRRSLFLLTPSPLLRFVDTKKEMGFVRWTSCGFFGFCFCSSLLRLTCP